MDGGGGGGRIQQDHGYQVDLQSDKLFYLNMKLLQPLFIFFGKKSS